MIKPPFPENEETRLKSLRKLDLEKSSREEGFDRITRIAAHVADVPHAAIHFLEEDQQWEKSTYGPVTFECSRDVSFCGHTILEEEPTVINNALDDERFHDNPLVTDNPGIRFYAGIPIHSPEGQPVGTLCVIDKEPRDIPDPKIKILKDLAKQAEQELIYELLHDVKSELISELNQAERRAATDNLTGLWNRGGTEKLLDRELDEADRDGTPLSVAMLDIDHFKQVNDNHGHAAGDMVLQHAADRIQGSIRPNDTAGRWGGEEFLVVLPRASAAEAEIISERICGAFCDQKFSIEDGEISVTVSIGVATMEDGQNTVENLVNTADKALYKAKEAGRDTVRCASKPVVSGG